MKKKLLLKTMLLLCALVAGSSSVWAENVTLAYSGGTTTNMVSGNNAETVGLDADEWSVTAVPTGAATPLYPGLHKSNVIRLYYNSTTSNSITVSSLNNSTINSITVNYGSETKSGSTTHYNGGVVKVGSTTISDTNSADDIGQYTIGGTSFTISNGNSSNVQVWIVSIVINYTPSGGSKPAPTFSLDINEKTLDAYSHETVDVTLTTNTDGTITCESTNDEIATVALKSAGKYTITAQSEGSATITIKSTASDTYAAASATVAITVTDNRADAGISFANNSVNITWGDEFVGQELTNTHSLAVTWSSTDETVATVNSSGVVNVLKAGSTTIKATFEGNATYKNSIAQYTLTISKASAGLSYAEKSFEIMLNDDSFVAPVLINPNGLTVTYSSNNETVAVVDVNTGELVYDENTEGTATITATFAGNDNYYPGSAYYTINIVDPSEKGTKYNPYTVAEVEGQESATTFGNNIYVTGYIVGSVSNNKCYKSTNNLVNTNLLLADTPDVSFEEGVSVVSNSDGLIPVELPSSPASIRSNWGVKDNNVMRYKVLLKGNAQAYFGTNAIKGTSEISAVSIPIKPAKTYTTLTSAYALDFTDVNNDLKAFIATEVSGGKVQMTQVNKVPAGTGLVLKATTPNSAVNVTVFDGTSPDDVSANKMAGSATATTHIAENGGYILSNGVFQPSTEGDLPAGKAYLNIAVTSAPVLELNFGEATAIEKIANGEEPTANGQYYNMNGQRVAQPTKGLYIVNGRKVVIK